MAQEPINSFKPKLPKIPQMGNYKGAPQIFKGTSKQAHHSFERVGVSL